MTISVSTVTPVYSGADYLPGLVEQLGQLRNKWQQESAPVDLIESLFVVDGAIDDSHKVLQSLTGEYDWIRIVPLSRNFGQHAATVAGICHTSSDWVVTLDEDLQHKPAEIETLFKEQVNSGADIVYAQPASTAHGNSWRDLSSRLVKKVIAKLTDTPQVRRFNSFRLIRGSIARAAASSASSQTYLDIAISWFTKSFSSVALEMHDDRFIEEGKSGYGLAKLIRHARHLIVSSQVDIATAGMIGGAISIGIAFIIGLVVILQRLFFPESIASAGWASIMALVTFFGGIIIALLCVALEYINVITLNQLGKPTFFTVDREQDSVLADWFGTDKQP